MDTREAGSPDTGAGSRITPTTTAKIALRITALYFMVRGLESIVTVFSFSNGPPGSVQYRIASAVGPIAGIILWFAAGSIAPLLVGRYERMSTLASSGNDEPVASTHWDPESVLRVSFAVVGLVFGIRGVVLVIQAIGQYRQGGASGASSVFSQQSFWLIVAGVVETVVGAALLFGTARFARAIHRMRYGDAPQGEDDEGTWTQ